MVQNDFIALVAGVASALLFASLASGWLIGLFLFYLAPVPVAVATMGWTPWAGLAAVGIGAAAIGISYDSLTLAGVHAIAVGLPAWWIGRLASVPRKPAPATAANDNATTPDWVPVGRIVFWCALLAAVIVSVALFNLGWDEATVRAALREAFQRTVTRTDSNVLNALVAIMPAAAAALTAMVMVLDTWVAARIVSFSGRSARPWPRLAAMRAPADALALLAAAIVASFAGGLAGMIGMIFVAAMVSAFAIYGLAALHMLTAPLGGRAFILGAAYAAIAILGWPLLAAAILGIADFIFDLRGRMARHAGPPGQV